MYKFYKHKLYRKYQDEIWGHVISKKTFSYNKKALLLRYRDIVLKNRLRIKTKFKYFRNGFLKNLKYALLTFKFLRKNIRVFLFKKRQLFNKLSSLTINIKKMPKAIFRGLKLLTLLRFNIYSLKSQISSALPSPLLLSKISSRVYTQTNIFNYPSVFVNKVKTLYRAKFFLRANNLQFIIKKRLNLRKQKTFFYSVHIAAPKKKTKKWSLFALKNIYYKKISTFFGFQKVADFLKVYSLVGKLLGRNSFGVFLMLEGRLENFLMRLNLFPSIYFIKKFIQYGNVFVNNKVINYPSYSLSFNEVVSFKKKYFKILYLFIKSQLRLRKIIINLPPFIEADYKLLVAMLIRNPDYSELTKPLSFDLYTKFLSVSR